MRLTLGDLNEYDIAAALGLCNDDPRYVTLINRAQLRLIQAMGETGAWGGWYKTVFAVDRREPYITTPPTIARLAGIDVCNYPIRINNEWYEFLEAGIGLQTPCGDHRCGSLQAFERGVVPTAFQLSPENQKLRIYITDPRDSGKRILFGDAKDQNGNHLYSTVNGVQVYGIYEMFASPFVTTDFIVTDFKNVKKDITFGDILLMEVDATTGVERLLSRYGANETNPAYRRYFIKSLPRRCCNGSEDTTQVTAMAKLEFVPVRQTTDFLIISNPEALREECRAITDADRDTPDAQTQAATHHWNAINLLNKEIIHYQGRTNPAINLAPWGTARLERQAIGTMI